MKFFMISLSNDEKSLDQKFTIESRIDAMKRINVEKNKLETYLPSFRPRARPDRIRTLPRRR